MAPPSDLSDSAPVSRRSALPFVLSGIMLAIYFGFIALVGYQQPLMGQQLVPGLSWGILLGAFVIVSAWVLTLVYVRSFNQKGGA